MTPRRLWVLLCCAAAATCTPSPEPLALVVPAETVLSGSEVDIAVTGLAPDQRVLLRVERSRSGREGRELYRAEAVFRADAQGRIHSVRDAAEGAADGEADPAYLFHRVRKVEGAAAPDVPWSDVRVGLDVDADGTFEQREAFALVRGLDSVKKHTLGDAFPGAILSTPSCDGPFALIVALGGSEGNDGAARAAAERFASRGYAVLGLPYYSPAWGGEATFPDLPSAFAEIDVAYLADAVRMARAHREVDPNRLALYGVSKGAEYALLAASLMPELGVDAVAAIVPSDVVWEGWGAGGTASSFAFWGEPLPFVPYDNIASAFEPGGSLRGPHDRGRANNPDRVEAARIRVESIDAPVFVVGGDKDTVWDSGGMARRIKAHRDAAGRDTEIHVGAAATHRLSGDGYGVVSEPADAALQARAFPALIAFLERNLAPEPDEG